MGELDHIEAAFRVLDLRHKGLRHPKPRSKNCLRQPCG
jgi:hypothetical protein